jgi:ribose 5-phosphate isomerase B
MRIAIGSDHAGFALKNEIEQHLREVGHEVLDLGTYTEESVDYPDYAKAVGEAVVDGIVERGMLICGSGVGVSVAANKIPGIRAAICHDAYSAAQGVEHDDMNVLVMGARVVGSALAVVLVDGFLGAVFSGEERHVRRLNKIKAIETEALQGKDE